MTAGAATVRYGREAGDFGRVAVLSGGHAPGRERSLRSGRAVLSALAQRGVDVLAFDPGERAVAELAALGVNRAWIALHGAAGTGGCLQGALEILGLPYSGSGVLGSAVCADRLRTKWLCDAVGVPTARCVVLRQAPDLQAALEQLGLPLIVKPARHPGASAARVDSSSELHDAWQAAQRFDSLVIAEPVIPGAQYTVAMLQGEALPSVRCDQSPGDARHYCPSGLSGQAEQHLRRLALAICAACGAAGWASAEFRMDRTGRPLLLEIDTVPAMLEEGPLPSAARAAGIDFEELACRVLETSFPASAGPH